jgi:hypothetical protein
MARSISTTDHDTIRKWAEERGGKPSEVAAATKSDEVAIIRIDFPGLGGEAKLQEISWDDWFLKFDGASLAFVYEEETAGSERSVFNELVGREAAEARAKGEKTSRRATRAGRSSSRSRAAAPRARRQAARPEAARTTRSKRSSRRGGAASRGSAQGKKRTVARKRTSTRSVAASSSRKGGRARGARKSR